MGRGLNNLPSNRGVFIHIVRTKSCPILCKEDKRLRHRYHLRGGVEMRPSKVFVVSASFGNDQLGVVLTELFHTLSLRSSGILQPLCYTEREVLLVQQESQNGGPDS